MKQRKSSSRSSDSQSSKKGRGRSSSSGKNSTTATNDNVSSVMRKEMPSPPFGLSIDSLKHSSNQSITLKRFLQVQKQQQEQDLQESENEEEQQLLLEGDEEAYDTDQLVSTNEVVDLNIMLLNQVKHPNELYEKCLKLTRRQYLNTMLSLLIKRPLFCPYQFKHFFYHHDYREYANARRALRKLIMIETIQALTRCKYYYASDDLWAEEFWNKKIDHRRSQYKGDPSGEEGEVDDNEEEDQEEEVADDGEDDHSSDHENDASSYDLGEYKPPEIVTVQLNWNKLVSNVKSAIMINSSTAGLPEKKKKKGRARHNSSSGSSDEEEEQAMDQKATSARFEKTDVYVLDSDCLSAAILLKRQYKLNPLLLVMASQSHPGGGYKNGSGAQEEEISRRSQLFMCLDDPYLMAPERSWSYPLPEFGGVYVPRCTVIRDSERDGYALLPRPIDISMIAMAAYSNPPIERAKRDSSLAAVSADDEEEEWRFSGKIISKVKQKMRVLFDTAVKNKHDSMVLSAWGSGVYSSPAKHVAELFKQVLSEPQYRHMFRVVLFAIIDDQNALSNHANTRGNLQPFHDVFHGANTPVMTLSKFSETFSL